MEANPQSFYALIVDDNQLTQSILAQTLDRMDVTFADVVTATTGVEAMERYQELTDRNGNGEVLILLDLDMPVLGGLDALSMIRVYEQEHRLPPCRIVVVSALDDEDTVQRCYANGADAFYAKPIRTDKLVAFLQEE
jgi:CheY-like chemotaxis protein